MRASVCPAIRLPVRSDRGSAVSTRMISHDWSWLENMEKSESNFLVVFSHFASFLGQIPSFHDKKNVHQRFKMRKISTSCKIRPQSRGKLTDLASFRDSLPPLTAQRQEKPRRSAQGSDPKKHSWPPRWSRCSTAPHLGGSRSVGCSLPRFFHQLLSKQLSLLEIRFDCALR